MKHASHERTSTDSVVVCCRLSDGTSGWGEGLPRDYVTGDTIESTLELFQSVDWNSLLDRELKTPDDASQLVQSLDFPCSADDPRGALGNPLRCAVELSILDAVSRSLDFPFHEYLNTIPGAEKLIEFQPKVRYSAIVASSSMKKVKWLCRLYRLGGFRDCKVKVGIEGVDDRELLTIARRSLGTKISLRVDANESWNPEEVVRKTRELEPFRIVSIEQPVHHSQRDKLAGLRPQISIPIMLDESLCSLQDAEYAISHQLCDLFNIRLSKCGGFLNSVKIAVMAAESGLGFQMGSQVGETGILTAAGRQFVTHIQGWLAAEGSFDNHLVKERLTKEDLTFWIDGTGKALRKPGLGMTVDQAAVDRVTVQTMTHNLNVL
ncbi:MAG: dipeptide epimerase [Planctomycetaceae bacterium]|nr:dipeptide epimerase [Planctomycetaceae bacterium]